MLGALAKNSWQRQMLLEYIYIPRSSQGFPFLTSFGKGAFLDSEAYF